MWFIWMYLLSSSSDSPIILLVITKDPPTSPTLEVSVIGWTLLQLQEAAFRFSVLQALESSFSPLPRISSSQPWHPGLQPTQSPWAHVFVRAGMGLSRKAWGGAHSLCFQTAKDHSLLCADLMSSKHVRASKPGHGPVGENSRWQLWSSLSF